MAAPQNFSNNFGTNHFIKLEIRDSRSKKKRTISTSARA